MSPDSFNMEEFMKAEPPPPPPVEEKEAPELDVQKAVVEALAADKAELERDLSQAKRTAEELRTANEGLSSALEELKAKMVRAEEQEKAKEAEFADFQAREASCKERIESLEASVSSLKAELARKEAELAAQMEKEFDHQERNPNALALLDRDVELPDRFPGETRDHVLEVVSAAREAAEAEGRVRRAQVLEGVLVANEPNGTLSRKRAEMEHLFAENGNIISGAVIEALQNEGLSHKNGDEFLMPSEILKRNY